MLFAAIAFFVALCGIVALFGLKYWELKKGSVLFPAMRTRADGQAIHLKELMLAARADLSNLPDLSLRLGRILLHRLALLLASLARIGERQAHRLADMVSYKHRFEKRETRSEFLRKVSERRNGSGLDTPEGNGQSDEVQQ